MNTHDAGAFKNYFHKKVKILSFNIINFQSRRYTIAKEYFVRLL